MGEHKLSQAAGRSVNWFSQFGELFDTYDCNLLLEIFAIRCVLEFFFFFFTLKVKGTDTIFTLLFLMSSGAVSNVNTLICLQWNMNIQIKWDKYKLQIAFAHLRTFTATGLCCKVIGKGVSRIFWPSELQKGNRDPYWVNLNVGTLYDPESPLLSRHIKIMGFDLFWMQSTIRNTVPVHICMTKTKVSWNSIYPSYRRLPWCCVFQISCFQCTV